MTFIKIALRDSVARFDRLYTYLLPSVFESQIRLGQRVFVPFGRSNRGVEGIVLDILPSDDLAVKPSTDGPKLKEIFYILHQDPVLQEDQIQLLKNMVVRYACTWSAALRLFLPSFMRVDVQKRLVLTAKGREQNWETFNWPNLSEDEIFAIHHLLKALLDRRQKVRLAQLETRFSLPFKQLQFLIDQGYLECLDEVVEGMKDKVEESLSLYDREKAIHLLESEQLKSIGQIRVLQLLLEYPQLSLQDCCQICLVNRPLVQNMVRRGWLVLTKEKKPLEALTDTNDKLEQLLPKPVLNVEQQEAVDSILASMKLSETKALPEKKLNEHLLWGITGSGKTEVYLHLAEAICASGKGVIMLVPEISLTPQMTERFQNRFGSLVAVLHSRLTPRQRFGEWQRLLFGEARIAIGPRSAIFSPVRDLGMIMIDEEQEGAYCAENHPRYDARTVARLRAVLTQSLLLLGSATPSIETFYRTKIGKSTLHHLTKRANQAAVLPDIHLIDMRTLQQRGKFDYFADEFILAMERHLARQEQCMVLLNRRGYAHAYFCFDCGKKLDCPNCSVPMTFHKGISRLVCHYCGRSELLPSHCPHCGSKYLHPTGVGIEQVEKKLGELFPKAHIIRMDQDTTATRLGHSEILRQFQDGKADILLGTQMIAKGHDFPNVTFVGILGIESALYTGDFRATERCFQLLTQAAGRAGRADKKGEVYIQTYQPDAYAITYACSQDYLGFYQEELKYRELLHYPPFVQLLQLTLSGETEEEVKRVIRYLALDVETYLKNQNGKGYQLFAPHRPSIPFMYKKHHWQLFLKCTEVQLLQGLLAYLSKLDFNGDLRLKWQLDPG